MVPDIAGLVSGVVFAIILGLFVWVSISNDEDDVDLISNIKAMLDKNDRV